MAKHILVVASVMAIALAMVYPALADIPQLISFQGKLYDDAGNPLTDEYEITFRIYEVETDGSELWSETINVNCEDGLYNVILGLTTTLNLDFDGQYWLGVQVTGDDEFSPRYRLVSVPTAFRAQVANQVSWTNLTDMPAGFADGTDDVGEVGGVSQIDAGTGIEVTNPTGPTTTVSHAADASTLPDAHHTKTTSASELTSGTLDNTRLNMGHANGIDADMVDGQHASEFAAVGHEHNADYVNEGQTNSITSGMIVDGTIQQADLSFAPGDITAVNAGNGLSGDGTSGDVTLNVGSGTGISVDADAVGLASNYADGSVWDSRFVNTIGPEEMTGSSSDPILTATNSGSGHGVYGKNQSSGNWGWLGSSNSGVSGWSSDGEAVYGGSNSGDGVYGQSNSGAGVYGKHTSSGNWGVLGSNNSAVRGNSDSGWAGYFEGKTYMEGNVGIGAHDPTNLLELSSESPKLYFNRENSTSNLSGLYWRSNSDNFEGAFVRNNGTGDIELYTNITGGTPRMVITNAGSVGIGTGSPNYTLDVRGTIGNNTTLYHSDVRWKKNINDLSDALDTVMKLRGVSHEWRRDEFVDMNFSEGQKIGFIAQEVEQVLPALVTTDANGYKNLEYAKITAVLVEAIKELKVQNDRLKVENEAMKERMDILEKAID